MPVSSARQRDPAPAQLSRLSPVNEDLIRLWVDDERNPAEHRPGERWVWVRTVADACRLLATKSVSHLSLDHDLGVVDEHGRSIPEEEGYAICTFIAQRGCWPTSEIVVHSMNSVAAERMMRGFEHDSRGLFRRLPGTRRLVRSMKPEE